MFTRPVLFCFVLALASAGASAPSFAQSASSAEGYWVTKGFVVHMYRCSSGLCGELVGLDKGGRADSGRLDLRNSDRNKRTRPLCGIGVFGAFHPSSGESGKWDGGWIYNPEDGRTYKSEMRLVGPDTLKVRGYVLTKLFGRDLTLTRETDPVRRCSPDPLSSARS